MRPSTTLTIPLGPRTEPRWASLTAVSLIHMDLTDLTQCPARQDVFSSGAFFVLCSNETPSGTRLPPSVLVSTDASFTCAGGRAQELQNTLDSTE